MNNHLALIILCISFVLISCAMFEKATPVPTNREEFVGRWKSQSGVIIEIKASGYADLFQNIDQANPDCEKLCIKVGPPVINDIFARFEGDSILTLIKPTLYAKEYRIDQLPSHDTRHRTIVLNGVTLIEE